jgi:hypothetical protein
MILDPDPIVKDGITSNAVFLLAECSFDNCDNNPANGCEINLTNDVNNCGRCGKVATLANAVATCQGSQAQVDHCLQR